MPYRNEITVYCQGFSKPEQQLIAEFLPPLSLTESYLPIFIESMDDLANLLEPSVTSLILLAKVDKTNRWDELLQVEDSFPGIVVSLLGLTHDPDVVEHSLHSFVAHHRVNMFPTTQDEWSQLPSELDKIVPLAGFSP